MRKSVSALLAGLCAVALVGCGGSGSTVLGIDDNPRVRVVNAISSPDQVTIRVNNEAVQSSTAFGFESDYKTYTNGPHNVTFVDATTQATLVNASDALFELNHYYTIVGYRNLDGSYSYVKLDDKPTTSMVDGQIRVINVSNTNYDIYVTPFGSDIGGSPATYSNVASGDTTQGYVTAPLNGSATGQFQVRVTIPGFKTVIASTNVTLSPNESATVLVTSNGTSTPTLQVLTARDY